MCPVNYVELLTAWLQCCAVIVYFAAFHTNYNELTANLTVIHYDVSVIVNNYATITFEFRTFIVFERALPRDLKWREGIHLLLPWRLLIIYVTLVIQVGNHQLLLLFSDCLLQLHI